MPRPDFVGMVEPTLKNTKANGKHRRYWGIVFQCSCKVQDDLRKAVFLLMNETTRERLYEKIV